ncbi:MAG: hypothetical protein SWE60_13145 [Thermodesulfobacteriota bacterium]|nr:hypothetical protein [Thermodesulfobacteriota bacterium]
MSGNREQYAGSFGKESQGVGLRPRFESKNLLKEKTKLPVLVQGMGRHEEAQQASCFKDGPSREGALISIKVPVCSTLLCEAADPV